MLKSINNILSINLKETSSYKEKIQQEEETNQPESKDESRQKLEEMKATDKENKILKEKIIFVNRFVSSLEKILKDQVVRSNPVFLNKIKPLYIELLSDHTQLLINKSIENAEKVLNKAEHIYDIYKEFIANPNLDETNKDNELEIKAVLFENRILKVAQDHYLSELKQDKKTLKVLKNDCIRLLRLFLSDVKLAVSDVQDLISKQEGSIGKLVKNLFVSVVPFVSPKSEADNLTKDTLLNIKDVFSKLVDSYNHNILDNVQTFETYHKALPQTKIRKSPVDYYSLYKLRIK